MIGTKCPTCGMHFSLKQKPTYKICFDGKTQYFCSFKCYLKGYLKAKAEERAKRKAKKTG